MNERHTPGGQKPVPSKKKRPVLKLIGVAVLALVTLFVLVVASRPAEFHVERSVGIAAPPEVVFPLINDFHDWGAWSPWEHLDPAMKREHSGNPEGPGAAYSWSGNDDVRQRRLRRPHASFQVLGDTLEPSLHGGQAAVGEYDGGWVAALRGRFLGSDSSVAVQTG